jgi:hypothetical protein
MRRVLAAEAAELAEFEPLGALAPVFRRAVIPAFALGARQGNDFAHELIPWIWGLEDVKTGRSRRP